MSPGEHYAEAERLLTAALDDARANEHTMDRNGRAASRIGIALRAASIHAQLAAIDDIVAAELIYGVQGDIEAAP